MIDSILTKLGDVSSRYEEIESLLSQPDVTSNQEEYIKLSKEYADLSPVVNAFVAFKKAEEDLEEAKLLMKDSDPEIKEMAELEFETSKQRIDDLEIEFVFQQKVRKANGKIYLVDLFFPQFELYLEVNESYHLDDNQKLYDKLRMEQIWEITGWERHVISTEASLSEINHSIQKFVSVLKAKKHNLNDSNEFKQWTASSAEKINQILERGYLSAKLNDHLPKQADVTRLFGANHEEWMKGSYPYRKPFDFMPKMVWFPKLYKHSTWTNQLSVDGKKIIEDSEEE